MTTLIEIRNNKGLIGRCDAKCYNAQGKHCDCVCGGANHGIGKDEALKKINKHCDDLVKPYKNDPGFKFKVYKQLDLFNGQEGMVSIIIMFVLILAGIILVLNEGPETFPVYNIMGLVVLVAAIIIGKWREWNGD